MAEPVAGRPEARICQRCRRDSQVWIKNLATGDPVQLTFGDVPASRPRWSPRGDRIVYSTVGNGIWSVPSLGGEPRQIIRDGRNADLSRDGRRLVFERAGEIFIAGADGSGTRVLPRRPRSLNPYYGDSWPTLSPDGESIAIFLPRRGGMAITGSCRRTAMRLAESRRTFKRAARRRGHPTENRSSFGRHAKAVRTCGECRSMTARLNV